LEDIFTFWNYILYLSIIGTFDIFSGYKWEIEQEEQRGGQCVWRIRLMWRWISEGMWMVSIGIVIGIWVI
jgi:hypothetical protein